MNSEKAQKYIIDMLIDSLSVLAKNHKKFPNFDFDRFAAAFTECLGKPTDGREAPP